MFCLPCSITIIDPLNVVFLTPSFSSLMTKRVFLSPSILLIDLCFHIISICLLKKFFNLQLNYLLCVLLIPRWSNHVQIRLLTLQTLNPFCHTFKVMNILVAKMSSAYLNAKTSIRAPCLLNRSFKIFFLHPRSLKMKPECASEITIFLVRAQFSTRALWFETVLST